MRIYAGGHDVTDKMPLTLAVLKEQQEKQMATCDHFECPDDRCMRGSGPELETYDDGVERPAHSDKGASGAERWMNCVGSSALIAAMDLPQTDEPDYQREGIAMHEAAADCLARGIDTWEIAGDIYRDTVITPGMASAIQMYLDRVRPGIDPKGFHGRQFFIEAKLAAPDIHAKMFGSVDFGALVPPEAPRHDRKYYPLGFLDVTDLKGGEGIEVDPIDNAQMKYYAFMLIHTKFSVLSDDFPVRLTIVQPRCFSYEGPIREWWTTVGEIKAWVVRDLLPAMNSLDSDLEPGKWCRFCPAKIVCPMLSSLFKAAAMADLREIVDMTDQQLGLTYSKVEGVKFYLKALEETAYRRLMAGKDLGEDGPKLVNKKSHRIYKTDAVVQVEGKDVTVPIKDAMVSAFGKDAFNPPELKSPPELEALGPAGKEFVKQYAYLPVTGLTVAMKADKRAQIKIQTTQERFGTALASLTAEASTGD